MKKNKMITIILIEIYLTISVLLYTFGPIEYNKQNQVELYSFLAIFQIMLFVGYYVSEKYIKMNEINILNKIKQKYTPKFNLFMSIVICMSLFFSIMVIVRYANTFNVLKITKIIVNSLINPEQAYADKLVQSQENLIGGRYFTTIYTGLSWIFYVAIPLGLYKYKELNKFNRILVILCTITEVLSFVIKGTNFGIFRVAIIITTLILLKLYKRQIFNKMNKKKIIKNIFLIFTLLIIVAGYFMYSTTSRMGGNENMPKEILGVPINRDNFLLKLVPKGLKFGLVMVVSYISQGYNGMALAFNYDFNSTYGIGNSAFLTENFKDMFGIDVYSNTYQFKMRESWHPTINWHTAYTWFANDFSFWGVIVIMFLIGVSFNLILRDAVNENLIAISLLPLYIIMIIFLPCNNVIFNNPSTFMPFVIWNILWLLSKKYNIGVKDNERS